MYKLNYVPVNINCNNCTVYSERESYPIDMLQLAVDSLMHRESLEDDSEDANFIYKDNYMIFKKDTLVRWVVPEVFLAYEAYSIAKSTNFNFHVIYNESRKPRLFVSSEFKRTRIVVNPLTFQAVLIGQPEGHGIQSVIEKHVASLIRKVLPDDYCVRLFDTLCRMEKKNSNILEAVILWKGRDDECLAVNPVLTPYSNEQIFYGTEEIAEFRQLVEGDAVETESFILENNMIMHKQLTSYAPFPRSHAKYIVALFDRFINKKCDYVSFLDDKYCEHMYVATNFSFVVDTRNFVCYKINNDNIKSILRSFFENNPTSQEVLNLLNTLEVNDAKSVN